MNPCEHSLNLDHVLVVRASGAALSINTSWPEFVASGAGEVCVYGGIVRNAMIAELGASRVREEASYGEAKSHEWAAAELRAGRCAAYVQPKDRAERMLAAHNAAGGCDLRLRQPSGLPARGGGFATIQPFAREKEARRLNASATLGGGACTDIAIAAFSRTLQRMHVDVYPEFRTEEIAAIQADSGTTLTCQIQECESGELDLGFDCVPCDFTSLDCNQRYSVFVRQGFYRAPSDRGRLGLSSIGPNPNVLSSWPCTMRHACLGGLEPGDPSCAPGHQGVLCTQCEVGYAQKPRECEQCDAIDARGQVAALVALYIALLFAVCTIVVLYLHHGLRARLLQEEATQKGAAKRHTQPSKWRRLLALLGRHASEIVTLVKIILGYLQCASVFVHLDNVDCEYVRDSNLHPFHHRDIL